MSLSYDIHPIYSIQSNNDWMDYLKTIKIIGNLDLDKIETESRFPFLFEIYDAINDAEIEIESESKNISEWRTKEEGREVMEHIFGLVDKSHSRHSYDFTIHYPKNEDERIQATDLGGIKSDLRILVKLCSSLSKTCGSFIILSPYWACYIDKNKDFHEILKGIVSEISI